MSFIKNINAKIQDWGMNSEPPVDSYGYKDLPECDYRIYYKVCKGNESMECNKCIFNWNAEELCAHAPLCCAEDRADNTDIYFKAIDIKPLDELL